MTRKFVVAKWLLILLLIGLLIVYALADSNKRVFIGGQILTMDADNRVAQAVAVEDNMIIAVGSRQDVQVYIDQGFEVVDLEGKTMIPGFIDAHGHFPGSGISSLQVDLNSPPIGSVKNIEQLQATLRNKAAATTPGDWVMGFSYDDSLLAEKRHPTRQELDQVSTEHPIWIMHSSGHFAVLNSLALEQASIDEHTKDPEGGHIQRDGNGVATGLLEENAAHNILELLPHPSIFEGSRMMEIANQEYLAKGVTTAQSGLLTLKQLQGLALASLFGSTDLRMIVWPDYTAGMALIHGEWSAERWNNDFFQVGAIKLIADGSIQGYTGYLQQPYFSHQHGKGDDYRGYPRTQRTLLTEQITAMHKAGLQVAIHGNGDAAIDDIIAAYGKAQQAYPREDARPIVVHSQMASDAQLDQMKALGMTPTFFILHTYYWGDRHRSIFLGPERTDRISPAKSAVDRDLRFSLHSDTPVVPMDPLLMMWSAVNRQSYLGNPMGDEQKIDALQALRAVTIDAAWQVFQEDNRGSIEVGKFADLVVLAKNPLDNPAHIKDIDVITTYINGKAVYSK